MMFNSNDKQSQRDHSFKIALEICETITREGISSEQQEEVLEIVQSVLVIANSVASPQH
jgi:hypothetical protein